MVGYTVKPEGGDGKIPQGIGEEILRHPSSVWFCDLDIDLGEIMVWWGWRWFSLWIPLVFYGLVYPMRSHIHAWNMERGWLAERNIWFNSIYGRVVHGIPCLGWLFHKLIRAIFILLFMNTCIGYDVDIVTDFPWLLCLLFFGYMLVIWCNQFMTLDMFW